METGTGKDNVPGMQSSERNLATEEPVGAPHDERAHAPGEQPFGFHPVRRPGIGRTIAVMSGKGGVGKSAVAGMLAAGLLRHGLRVGVLDADVTGPSIPRELGVKGPTLSTDKGPLPSVSREGIKVVSMNLLLPEENEAVIWRGPLVSNVVRQFYNDFEWGTLDFLLVDLPPGTSDIPLTVMQSIPLDGILLVTSPQELAGTIVGKARRMADALGGKVIGLVENMSFVKCPKCDEIIEPFGESHSEEAAKTMGIELLVRLPLDPEISKLADAGRLEDYRSPEIDKLVELLIK